jgi:hypothetical protein
MKFSEIIAESDRICPQCGMKGCTCKPRYPKEVDEAKRKKKPKKKSSARGYFFPGYGYYGGSGDNSEGGGDGGGESKHSNMNENNRIARKPGQPANSKKHSESCPYCAGPMFSEELMMEKKDACYYKVKSRYKVWPSAYASGALVKCRKKGANNWGTKSESVEELDENLHQWFKEKWVRFGPDGKIRGDCARGDDSEGKPKCLPQAKAQSLGKAGRKYAASKKRREDPNPERSGPAKNVATKKKSNESVTEEQLDELKCWPGYSRVQGVPAGAPGSCKKKTTEGVEDSVQIEYWQQDTQESGHWAKTKPMSRTKAEQILSSFPRGEIVDVEQDVAEGWGSAAGWGAGLGGAVGLLGGPAGAVAGAAAGAATGTLAYAVHQAFKYITELPGKLKNKAELKKEDQTIKNLPLFVQNEKPALKYVLDKMDNPSLLTHLAPLDNKDGPGIGGAALIHWLIERLENNVRDLVEEYFNHRRKELKTEEDQQKLDYILKRGQIVERYTTSMTQLIINLGRAVDSNQTDVNKCIKIIQDHLGNNPKYLTLFGIPELKKREKEKQWGRELGLKEPVDKKEGIDEGETWAKHNNPRAGGMSKKSVSSYRRSHLGSKIQTAVTTKPSKLKKGSKAAARRKSFCARMRGMKKHRTGAKTARDPNSNINKSLRRWNCESVQELQELVMIAEQFIKNNK